MTVLAHYCIRWFQLAFRNCLPALPFLPLCDIVLLKILKFLARRGREGGFMKRKLAVLAILALVVGSGAFAQISIGASGALYTQGINTQEMSKAFQTGEGFFWGPFVELGFDTVVFGVSGNLSLYATDFGNGTYYAMEDMDVALYIQGHPLKYKNWFDPFIDVGIGKIITDFYNKTDDPDEDNPIAGSYYVQFGGGLNICVGALGVFAKGEYLMNLGPVNATIALSNGEKYTYELPAYSDPLKNVKIVVGAKLILGR